MVSVRCVDSEFTLVIGGLQLNVPSGGGEPPNCGGGERRRGSEFLPAGGQY